MRALILGASGRTGQLVTNKALASGHHVTALLRDPDKNPLAAHPRLTITQGTPHSRADIRRAFAAEAQGSDPIAAVIVTLAVPRTSESLFGRATHPTPTFLQECVSHAVGVMREFGVRRLVVLSAFGTGESWGQLHFLLKGLFSVTVMREVVAEHANVERWLDGEGEGVEWCLVKPTMLRDGEEKALREFGRLGHGVAVADAVTRESLARRLLDEAVGEWRPDGHGEGKIVVVAN